MASRSPTFELPKDINYKRKRNAKEAVAGFLWATAIVEKPGTKPMERKR
jgi:hypothetical protein